MYRFKEQYRDAKISIPSNKLVIDQHNVNQYAELIFKLYPAHKEMIEFVDDGKEEIKPSRKVKSKEDKTESSPVKTDD